VYGIVYDDSDILFLSESREDQERCYTADRGEEAQRLTKGDNCYAALAGTAILVEEIDNGAITVTIMDRDGKNEEKLLDDAENIGNVRLSHDGSFAAYAQETNDGEQLFLVERNTGAVTEASDEVFSIIQFSFVRGGDKLFYIAENEDGDLQLHISGKADPVATGFSIGVTSTADGKRLLYLVGDEDEERTAYVYDLGKEESTELLNGDNIEIGLTLSPEKILIQQVDKDEVTLYSADQDGSNLVQIFNDDNLISVNVRYIVGKSRFYIFVEDEDGRWSIYVAPADKDEGYYLLDEWNRIDLFNQSPNGNRLVFSGQEDQGDEPVLYTINVEDGADLVEIDDNSEGFRNAVFTANGKSVVYTTRTGPDPDDVEIIQAGADGEGKGQVLYEEAFLVDIRWGEIAPFRFANTFGTRSGTSFCPGAPSIGIDQALEKQFDLGKRNCFRFRAGEGDMLTFDLTSPEGQFFDFEFTLYDRDGVQLGYNDDSSGRNDPRMTITIPQSGIFFLEVSGQGSEESPDYILELHEGAGEPAVADAVVLVPGSPIRGTVTSSSEVHLESYDYDTYGNFYYFEGEEGDSITIDVFAESIGSSMDPEVYLFDSEMAFLDENDDGGDGLDSQLTFTLQQSGRYYVLVNDVGDEFGSAGDYFYEVQLTR
jgi:Tol biopolymer transport system component